MVIRLSNRVLEWQKREPTASAVSVAAVSLALLVGLNALLNFEPGLRSLYILPIWLAIRMDGKRAGLWMVLIATLAIAVLDLKLQGPKDWASIGEDTVFRFVSFVALTWVIAGVEERLSRTQALALHDPLTGLYNRRALHELWKQQVESATHLETSFTVVMIDCDGFKGVNDRFGHEAGDRVLQILARVLEHETRVSDIVARVGGDEFVLVLKEAANLDARRVLQRIEHLFESQVRDAGFECSISVGYAPVEPGNTAIEVMISRADRSMYERKEMKKSSAFLN